MVYLWCSPETALGRACTHLEANEVPAQQQCFILDHHVLYLLF